MLNNVEKVKQLFASIPPKWDEIKTILSSEEFSKEDLALIAIDITDDCFCEYRDALNPEVEDVTIDSMHSSYLLDSLYLLLEYGLDPNTIVDDQNVLWNTQWIDAPNVGAAALRLLLENGGNPNHFIPAEHETLFDYLAFKVSYDEYSHEWLYTVQCWLVLMAFGGCWDDGQIPLTMLGGNNVDVFKSFEDFDYSIEPLPQEPGKYGCWIMHIFRIENSEEVARYG